MNLDIGALLKGWSFDPDEFTARRITAADGTEKIQIRIDMGLLQLEMQGRPDGQRPHGFESHFHYCQHLIEEQAIENQSAQEAFALDEEMCEDLIQEAWQYYHRYLSLFYLEDYPGVVRDTKHNLALYEMVEDHAENDEARWYFEQAYPHAVMMLARARGMIALQNEDYSSALRSVQTGIEQIESFIDSWEEEIPEEDFPELTFLREWYEELETERPLSPEEQIERDLRQAVETENFEEAARLRDKLQTIRPPILGRGKRRYT